MEKYYIFVLWLSRFRLRGFKPEAHGKLDAEEDCLEFGTDGRVDSNEIRLIVQDFQKYASQVRYFMHKCYLNKLMQETALRQNINWLHSDYDKFEDGTVEKERMKDKLKDEFEVYREVRNIINEADKKATHLVEMGRMVCERRVRLYLQGAEDYYCHKALFSLPAILANPVDDVHLSETDSELERIFEEVFS